MPAMKKTAQNIYDMTTKDLDDMRAAIDQLEETIIQKIVTGVSDEQLRELITKRARLESAAARLAEMANEIYLNPHNWEKE